MKTVIAATALAMIPLTAYSATVSKQAMQDISSYFHISSLKQDNRNFAKDSIICQSIKQAFVRSVDDRNLQRPPQKTYKAIRKFQYWLAHEPKYRGQGPKWVAAQGSFLQSKALDKRIVNLVYFDKSFQDTIGTDFDAVKQYCQPLVIGSHPANPKWHRLK